jgi:hypothetical protein
LIQLRKFVTAALIAGAFATVAATTPAVATVATASQPGTVVVQLAPPDPQDGCRNHTIYRPPWYYVLVRVWSPNGAFYVGDYNVYHLENGNLVPWGTWEWRC